MQALGSPMVPTAIQALQTMSNGLNSLSGTLLAHPEMAKAIGESIAVLAAALAGAGVVALGTLLVGAAPIAAAIGGIVAAAAAFAAFNWRAIADAWNWISEAATRLVSVGWQKIVDMFNAIAKAIEDFVNKLAAIASSIAGAFAHSGAAPGQFTGTARGGVLLHKESYVPPSGGSGQPVVIHTALNVDGRTLAKAVGTHMARNSYWSNNSSTFDGSSMPPTTDMSFA